VNSRFLLIAGAAGLCLATIGSAVPALAAPAPAAASSPVSPGSPARAGFSAEVTQVTSTAAVIRVASPAAGSDITISDGAGVEVERHVYFAVSTLDIPVAVAAGHQYHFTVTQTVPGADPVVAEIDVDTDITSLPAPTTVTATTDDSGKNTIVRFTGGVPLVPIEVRNIYGRVVFSVPAGADGSAVLGGRGSTDLTDQHLFVRQVFSDTVASAPVDVRVSGLESPHDVPQPTFTVEEKNGATTITATRDDDTYAATLVLRDGDYELAGQALFHGKTASVSLPTPKAAQLWRLSENDSGDGPNRESVAKEIVLNEGVGSVKPDKPVVDGVTMSGATAIAQLDTAKNAVVTVRDERGSIVAVRSVGTSGRASVSIPKAGASGHEYTVTQSTGSMSSDPAAIDLP
jgi:hypothetical protein